MNACPAQAVVGMPHNLMNASCKMPPNLTSFII